DQGVVELAQVIDRLYDPADFVIGVSEVGPVNVGLLDVEFLLLEAQRIPLRQVLRPRRQLGIGGHDAEPLLIGKDSIAQFVPSAIEQMLVADLLDPLGRRMMRRVSTTRYVVDEERLVGRDLLELRYVLDSVVSHRGGEVPSGVAVEGVDRRRVAKQVRLPLARVAADEAVEIFETHPNGPLIEWPGLARLVKGRVVILAEPRGRVAVLLEDLADSAGILPDDRIVAGKSRRRLAHNSKAGHVMVASCDQRGARG